MLNKTIRKKYGLIKHYETKLKKMKDEMKNSIGKDKLEEMIERIDIFTKKEVDKQNERHRRKLQFWIKKYRINYKKYLENTDIPYINLSKFKPSQMQDQLLKLGPKYTLEQPIYVKDSIAKIETAIDKSTINMQLECRLTAKKEITKKLKENGNNKFEIEELRKLKINPKINCIETDKTGKIAILDNNDYINLMEEAIKKLEVDKLKTDPVNKIIKKVNDLFKNRNWPNNVKPKKNHTPITPRIFGKLKDHKTPLSIRPIVSKIEGPTYEIERYMKQIYQKILPHSNKSIGSTQEFIRLIKDLDIKNDEILVSFDVENLFPSIDIQEIGKITEEKLIQHFKEKIETQNLLISATNLLLNSSVFQFNGTFYRQKKGLPMGSPISGVMADLKMRILEEIINNDLKDNIILWIRYVDDIFAIIKNIKPEELLDKLNTYDKNIKFTYETEKDNRINYLDVTIFRKSNGKIETTVYRKPSANCNMINYKSKTPFRYKKSVLISYINRALYICSNEEHLNKEFEEILNIAKKAGYNQKFLKRLIKERKQKMDEITSGQKQRNFFTTSIPFDKGIGEIIHNIGKKYNVQIPVKPNKNIIQIIKRNKDSIDHRETSGIYQINYKDKHNKEGNYIGVTERRIKTRVMEHKNDIKLERSKSALTMLENAKDLKIDFDNPIKLASFNNHRYAYKREAIEILANTKSCNLKEHSRLPRIWKNLLYKCGKQSDSEDEVISLPDDDTE